jgi:dolichol-phosphate mannosyltransferase
MQSQSSRPLVSIVVPTLNESPNIDPLLTQLFDALRDQPFDAEVVVVDDGSEDGTRDRVREWESDHPVRLLERGREGGLSGAVLAGAQMARGEVVVVIDADLSHPPGKVPALIQPILDNQSDMVVGSRYVRGGSTPGWPLLRRLMSRTASWLAWPIVDVHDPMSGFFAIRRDRMLERGMQADGFKIGLELLAGGPRPLRVCEVPIQFKDRQHGESKLGSGVIISYLERLRALAGGSVSPHSALKFAMVGSLGLLLDLIFFMALIASGTGLIPAHLLSFLVATVFNYTFNARWSFADSASGEAGGTRGWRRYARFLIVALLALMLRGAVLGTLVEVHGWSASLAIVLAAFAAAGVNYLGSAFYVFPLKDVTVRPETRWRVAAVGVVGYMLLLRLFYMGLPDLMMEEAYYWNYAQRPALGYLDHPPMVAWLIWLGTAVFGDTETGVRVSAFVCWCITGLFGYLTAKDLTDKSTATRSLLLLAVLPFFFFTGLIMTPDAPLTASWAGALYFLQRALLKDRRGAWWGVGLCVGLGMLSKYTIALLGPATLLFMLMDRRLWYWLRQPGPYISAVLAAVVFSPVIVWNAQNQWASFAFQSVRRLEEKAQFGLLLLIGSMFLLVTPFGLIAAAKILTQRKCGPETPGKPVDTAKRRWRFAFAYLLAPLSVFFLFSLRHDPKLNWTGPLWLAVMPFIAGDLLPWPGEIVSATNAAGRRLWRPTIVVCMLGYGMFLHYLSLGFPGVPYPSRMQLVGWGDLAEQIEVIEEELEKKTGIEPVVVALDHYSIASHLSFYRNAVNLNADGPDANDELDELQKGEPHKDEGIRYTTGRQLFGGGSLMYEQWFTPLLTHDTPLIIIDDDTRDMESPAVTDYFQSLSPVKTIRVHARGRFVTEFYYRIGIGYHPPAE